MRASLATALAAWSMLTGLGLVFAQLTQLQDFNAPGHPEVRWAYAVFDVTLALSALVAAAIVVAVIGLCLWARHFAGYHHSTIPGIYLALVIAAAIVTTVSAARGTRAALAEP